MKFNELCEDYGIKEPDADSYDYQNLRNKVRSVEYNQALRLIYQWVKEGRINLKVFAALIKEIGMHYEF